MTSDIEQAAWKTAKSFRHTMPILISVMLLVSLAITAIPSWFYSSVFSGNAVLDSFLGTVAGSIAAGNPINSYVIGGELLSSGVSLMAIGAFIFAWVTVGLVQFPAESMMLGRKFAVARNTVSFCMAIGLGVLLAAILGVL